MSHTSDGLLRRLVDEPFAVADAAVSHVDACERCRDRSDGITADAATAHRILTAPRLAPDVEGGWQRLRAALDSTATDAGAAAAAAAPSGAGPAGAAVAGPAYAAAAARPGGAAAGARPAGAAVVGSAGAAARPAGRQAGFGHRRPSVAALAGLSGLSLRTALAVVVVALVLAGGAAAASVTGVFAPTHVVPVPISSGDLQAIAGLMDVAGDGFGGGFPTPTGSGTLAFGTLRWSTTGTPQTYSSLSQAEAATGLSLVLPAHLPAGVGQATKVLGQATISATVTFDTAAGDLAGDSITVAVGPAVAVEYGATSSGATGSEPILVVGTLPRPTATTSGATLAQVESFLLSRPGVPPALAEEIRLLGNIADVLPVPVPAGLRSQSVKIGAWPGVAVSDRSGVASAAIYEDGNAVIHAAAGLVNQREILDVAKQLG